MTKTKRKFISDDQLVELVQKTDDAKKLITKTGLTLNTLRKRLFEISVKKGELISADGLFQESDEVEVKKSGLTVSRRILEHQRFAIGQTFKMAFEGGKKITLTLQ